MSSLMQMLVIHPSSSGVVGMLSTYSGSPCVEWMLGVHARSFGMSWTLRVVTRHIFLIMLRWCSPLSAFASRPCSAVLSFSMQALVVLSYLLILPSKLFHLGPRILEKWVVLQGRIPLMVWSVNNLLLLVVIVLLPPISYRTSFG